MIANVMVGSAPMGSLTQGTIFSCAIAEAYGDTTVHGLVITARCDITNDKADVYNYVPVIRFRDWLNKEGTRILASRVSRSANGELKSKLKSLDFAPSILETTSPRDVLRVIFEDVNAPSKVRSMKESFSKSVDKFERARLCSQLEFTASDASALLTNERLEASKIIKELCQNQIAEAYFLPCVEPGEACDGYVALLREIRHLPRELAAGIAEGMDFKHFNHLCQINPRNHGRLSLADDDFAWPIGVLQSPFIEHLMQRLTLLFSRIGVTDVADDVVQRLQMTLSTSANEG